MSLTKDAEKGILYRTWMCPSARAVFLLVHGLGASSGRWDSLAANFLEKQVSSYALELKGFGETDGLKGHIDSLESYFRDIVSLCDIARKENPGKKIFLIGESLGALISFLLAQKTTGLFNGVIGLSPAFKSRLKFTLQDYFRIFIFLVLDPRKQLPLPFGSGDCTRDADRRKDIDRDQRECRVATPKLLWNIFLAQLRVVFQENRIAVPVFFLVAGELDQMTDPGAVKKIYKSLKCPDKEIIEYPEMFHALSVELGREQVFRDILNWVEKRIL